MRKMSEMDMRNADGGRKHYYELECSACGWNFADNWLGAVFATAHINASHGGNAYYFFVDVCVAMGAPH